MNIIKNTKEDEMPHTFQILLEVSYYLLISKIQRNLWINIFTLIISRLIHFNVNEKDATITSSNYSVTLCTLMKTHISCLFLVVKV